jgi:vacuolar-type H+-ATPase subunit E/Vma4
VADEAEMLLREAEDRIEGWLCELDASWCALLANAESDAEHIRNEALADAGEIVASARLEAEEIVAAAHATAGEHADVIRALAVAERDAADEELVSLRDAVARLRRELSRLVDAAFDALPAVEATAEAIDRALDDDVIDLRSEPEIIVIQQEPRRGLLRRLLRR